MNKFFISQYKDLTVVQLESEISRLSQKYYEGNPEISDSEFDDLIEYLRSINPDSQILSKVGWGYEPSKELNQVKKNHLYGKVYGIDRKCYEIDQIPQEFINETKCRISAKLDGLTVVLYYKYGKLILALTRGNGEKGIDITSKAKYILSRSQKHVDPDFTGAIRGELVISNNKWKEFLSKKGNVGKNQRNYASGIVRRNSIDSDLDYVDIVVYKVIASETTKFSSLSDIDLFLSRCFDNVVQKYYYSLNGFIVKSYFEKLYSGFNNTYLCDGIVITSNNIATKSNNEIIVNEIAFKFSSDTDTSEVTEIEWNLSRTGKLVPTVIIDPIQLDGTTVRRSNGFNAKYISDNKIDSGAVIEIMKSGTIIPDIQKTITPSPTFSLPEVCPVCNSKLEMIGVDLCCTNEECEGKTESDLMMWTNLIGEVHGLGYSIKKKFFNNNGIQTIEQLYEKSDYLYSVLKENDSATNKKLTEMMDKLIKNEIDVPVAYCALNIKRLGWNTAIKLSESQIDLSNYNENDVREIVGEATFESISRNESKLKRLDLIHNRLKFPSSNNSEDEEKISIAVTGKLSVKRKDFESIINENGYKLSSNLKECKYLVTNNPDSGSSKNRKAKDLGVNVISEDNFYSIINGGK